jgi:hypothetical protein
MKHIPHLVPISLIRYKNVVFQTRERDQTERKLRAEIALLQTQLRASLETGASLVQVCQVRVRVNVSVCARVRQLCCTDSVVQVWKKVVSLCRLAHCVCWYVCVRVHRIALPETNDHSRMSCRETSVTLVQVPVLSLCDMCVRYTLHS